MSVDPSNPASGEASTAPEEAAASRPGATPPPVGPRQVRPRDWFVFGLVAGLALALGGYLVVKTASDGDADTVAAGRTVTVSALVTTTVTATPGTDDDGALGPGDDVAESVIQPPGVVEPNNSGDAATGDSGAGDSAAGDSATGDAQQAATPTEAIGPVGDQARRVEGDPLALGPVDAPVVMVMYSDYRCPFCAMFSRELEPKLVAKYVDSGVLRIEWRDFPIFGHESEQAAIAGRAAARQGKFWEFNRTLYAAAPQSGHPDYSTEDLVGFARDAGVPDIDAFKKDMQDPALYTAVSADFDEGNSIGVPATPSFVINGYPVRGAQPIDEFYRLIDTIEKLQ